MKTPQLLAAAALSACVACAESFKPTPDNVTGFYLARSLTTDSAGTATDWVGVGEGGNLRIWLNPDGQMQGQLILAHTVGDTAAFIASMDGTWSLTGDTIRFTQTADTFVRDMDWIVTKDRLSADQTFGDVRVRVVLMRVPFP